MSVAVTIAAVAALTEAVVITKVPDVAPAGTERVAGTVTRAGLLLTSMTVEPPAGAAAERVTVPIVVEPPITDAAARVTAVTEG